jgi:hypothetical protein
VQWQNRAHFYGIAAQIMRRILIDHARQHLGTAARWRQGDLARGVAVVSDEHAAELVALDDALKELEKVDKRKSRSLSFGTSEVSAWRRSRRYSEFLPTRLRETGDVQRHSCAGN